MVSTLENKRDCGCREQNEFNKIIHKASCPMLIWEYLIGDGSPWTGQTDIPIEDLLA